MLPSRSGSALFPRAMDNGPMSDAPKQGWMARLRAGLSRSSSALKDSIGGIFTRKKLDAASLEELEEALIMADLGVTTAGALVDKLRRERFGKETTETEVRELLADTITDVLQPWAKPIPTASGSGRRSSCSAG